MMIPKPIRLTKIVRKIMRRGRVTSVRSFYIESRHKVASPRAQLAWLSLAMLLGMTLWFSATAATAPIVAEFTLTGGEAAWLTMAVQGGFVAGTLMSAAANLPDLIN